MAWPYPFPDDPRLTPDEASTRRLILNKYGFVAQLSALVLLTIVALWAWLLPSTSTRPASTPNSEAVEMTPRSQSTAGEGSAAGEIGAAASTAEDAHGEEETEGLMGGGGAEGGNGVGVGVKATAEAATTRQMKRSGVGAWLDESVRTGWRETRRQLIAVGLWGIWLLVLLFRETGHDYLHLTKRFAQLAAALLPFHYLLGTPTRLSPLPYLFRVTNSGAFNAYHRIHAVLVLGLMLGHALFYINFYVQRGFWFRFGSVTVIMGLCMVTTMTVVTIMAREKVRKGWRPGFVVSHVAGTGLLLVFLWIHVSVARWYVVEAGVVYIAGLYERWRRTRSKST